MRCDARCSATRELTQRLQEQVRLYPGPLLPCFFSSFLRAACRLIAEWKGIRSWATVKDPDASIILGRDGFEAAPVSDGDLSVWRMRFFAGGCGLPDYTNTDVCKFLGACFEAELRFTSEYPYGPPHFKFIGEVPYHPNVYHTDDAQHGDICISMLHPPGRDAFNESESAQQRWKSDYTIRAIGVNVLDLLGHPNMGGGKPASAVVNGVLNDPMGIAKFQQKTLECAKRSREGAPKVTLCATPFIQCIIVTLRTGCV